MLHSGRRRFLRFFFLRSKILGAMSLLMIALTVLHGCGDGDDAEEEGGAKALYVPASDVIAVLRINANNGGLRPIAGSPYAISSYSIAVDPLKRFMYASTGGAYLVGYTINPATGALTQINGGPFWIEGSPPLSIAFDPAGKFVYTANGSANSISALTVASTGILTPVAGSPFATGQNPQHLVVSPNGLFVYTANTNDNTISMYRIDALTGALTAITGSPYATGASPRSIAIDPSGKYMYVSNYGSTISALAIDAVSGALSPLARPVYAGGGHSIVVDRSGKFVYATSGFNVYGYSLNAANGELTALPLVPQSNDARAHKLVVDGSGKYLYVAEGVNSRITAFAINPVTGELTAVSGSPFAVVPGSTVGHWPTDISVSL